MKDYIIFNAVNKSINEVFEPFAKLNKHEKTVFQYIKLCNLMFEKHSVKKDFVVLFKWNYFSAKLCDQLLDFDSVENAYKSFKKLKYILKDETLLIRRHYIYKMEGIFFEKELEELFPKWKKSDNYIDRTYHIDFFDYENNFLIQGKYSGKLAMKEFVFESMINFKSDFENFTNWEVLFVWKSKINGEIKFFDRNREVFDYGNFFKTKSK